MGFADDAREIPITTSSFWRDESQLDVDKFKYVFRSATEETMPLLTERLQVLREAGAVLEEVNYNCFLFLLQNCDFHILSSSRPSINNLITFFYFI